MKYDLNLVRDILLQIEKEHSEETDGRSIDFIELEKKHGRWVVDQHLLLLVEDNYIEGVFVKNLGTLDAIYINRLLNKGHSALEALRNDTIFEKVKNKIGEEIGSTTLSIAVALATKFLREKLGLADGN